MVYYVSVPYSFLKMLRYAECNFNDWNNIYIRQISSNFQSQNTSRTPAPPTYTQCSKHVASSLFKFRRMDETPPIVVTIYINSQTASWSNLCFSDSVEIIVWPYIWNTMNMKLHVKICILSRKFNTNFYLRQTCQNFFKLAVVTNQCTTVCVTPAKLINDHGTRLFHLQPYFK